ncbi:MAG: serine/threonine protein kinase [Desulfobacterota bacterium]|jgi:serine/threonine-protein kinase|nr:serine/threonine protein kinase [Thermodesulfobacteriota bacterium]
MKTIDDVQLDHLIGMEVGTATILKELARGGSAAVFIAFQRTLKRQIAIKILPKSLLTPETAERFQTEAESAAILSHPNIIPVYEVGETGDFLFIAMQLIQGQSLSHHIKAIQKHVLPSRRYLPVETTVAIMAQVLDGLDYAHHQDIIHRDIKPGNILVESRSRRPVILDFGIARVSRGLENESSSIQGTPIYMPPEQIRNETPDRRADIYASGMMLFEMLVTALPLPKMDPVDLLFLKLEQKDRLFMRRPSEMNPKVFPDMDRIVFKAISFDPGDRFASCAEFRQALFDYQKRHHGKV